MKFKIDLEVEKGDLPFLVFWQSLNGLPCFESFTDIDKAIDKLIYLRGLRLTPKLFIDAEKITFKK